MSLTDFADLGNEASWNAFKDAAAILSSIPLPLVADYILEASDNGMVYRSDSSLPFVVTVPANLPEGFSAGLLQWGSGTITVAAGVGAVHRGVGVATTQYGFATVYVGHNPNSLAAEFIMVGGA